MAFGARLCRAGVRGRVRAAGEARLAQTRPYFREAAVTITREMIKEHESAPRPSKYLQMIRDGPKAWTHVLNVGEKAEFSHARIAGFLFLGNSSSQRVVDHYLCHCWGNSLLALVLHKHGDRLLVNIDPAFGEEAPDDVAKASMRRLVFDVLSRDEFRGCTFVNAGTTSNLKEAEKTGREGRNEYKAASSVMSDCFTVYIPHKSQGIALSRAIWAAFCEKRGLSISTEDHLLDLADRRVDKAEARKQMHLRTLDWIERTPEVRDILPRGSLDGYRRAKEAGMLESVEPVEPVRSFSRRELRMRRNRRNSYWDKKAALRRAARQEQQEVEEGQAQQRQ